MAENIDSRIWPRQRSDRRAAVVARRPRPTFASMYARDRHRVHAPGMAGADASVVSARDVWGASPLVDARGFDALRALAQAPRTPERLLARGERWQPTDQPYAVEPIGGCGLPGERRLPAFLWYLWINLLAQPARTQPLVRRFERNCKNGLLLKDRCSPLAQRSHLVRRRLPRPARFRRQRKLRWMRLMPSKRARHFPQIKRKFNSTPLTCWSSRRTNPN